MPTCPNGHDSEWPDYCSVCGVATVAAAADSCPQCGEPRIGPFCEQCGHSYALPASSSWCAVIAPDREFFEANKVGSEGYTFPASDPVRRVELIGAAVRIGRRSVSRRITPEIDLANDPGVSREHARLLIQPDGSWVLVDEGSMNGTYLNGATTRIPVHQPVPLADGDRVHLGVWTTITLHSRSLGAPGSGSC